MISAKGYLVNANASNGEVPLRAARRIGMTSRLRKRHHRSDTSRPMNGANTRARLFVTFLLAPALLVILAVVLFPFLFNVILSFSNANLYHIRDWRLIGFAQYVSVFKQQLFWSILLKTVIWTIVNIVFHVVIGVFLAVVLHQKFVRGIRLAGRAHPSLGIAAIHQRAYLRGMFNYEYGSVNLHHEISAPLAGAVAHFAVRGFPRCHHH